MHRAACAGACTCMYARPGDVARTRCTRTFSGAARGGGRVTDAVASSGGAQVGAAAPATARACARVRIAARICCTALCRNFAPCSPSPLCAAVLRLFPSSTLRPKP
eukprot:365235-Chlamydomonas_euryale.AAC.8